MLRNMNTCEKIIKESEKAVPMAQHHFYFRPYHFSLTQPQKDQQTPKMLIYQDVLTGDEMLSDAFPMYVYTPHNPTFPRC